MLWKSLLSNLVLLEFSITSFVIFKVLFFCPLHIKWHLSGLTFVWLSHIHLRKGLDKLSSVSINSSAVGFTDQQSSFGLISQISQKWIYWTNKISEYIFLEYHKVFPRLYQLSTLLNTLELASTRLRKCLWDAFYIR